MLSVKTLLDEYSAVRDSYDAGKLSLAAKAEKTITEALLRVKKIYKATRVSVVFYDDVDGASAQIFVTKNDTKLELGDMEANGGDDEIDEIDSGIVCLASFLEYPSGKTISV